MSKKYITTRKGNRYTVDFFCYVFDGKTNYAIETDYSSSIHTSKVHYRPERTWDDHIGNTPCGYFCNVIFPDGCKHRVYMH